MGYQLVYPARLLQKHTGKEIYYSNPDICETPASDGSKQSETPGSKRLEEPQEACGLKSLDASAHGMKSLETSTRRQESLEMSTRRQEPLETSA